VISTYIFKTVKTVYTTKHNKTHTNAHELYSTRTRLAGVEAKADARLPGVVKATPFAGTHKLTNTTGKKTRTEEKQCKRRHGSPGGAADRRVNGKKEQNRFGLRGS